MTTEWKQAQEIIKKIPVNRENFKTIAEQGGHINGSLMASLCELIIQFEKDKKDAYSAGLMCERILAKEEIEKLKKENERLQKESKWNLEQCVKLQAEKAELIEALNDMVESYQYEASMENPTLLKAKEVLAKHETK